MNEAAGRRLEEALRLLGSAPDSADALTRADALWVARLLPDVDTAGGDDERGAEAGDEGSPGAAPADTSQDSDSADDDTGDSKTGKDADALRRSDDNTALFVQQEGIDDEPMLHARRVPVPAADALPGRAALERALRPFLRRRPSRVHYEVDAAATAEASAAASVDAPNTGDRQASATPALVPVLRPVPERWFDVVLLAERDDTMRVFEETLRELRQLLARHGAFRRVGLWRWHVQRGAVQVETAAGMPCAPRAMLQGQHPQLVWLLTHGASARWAEGPLRDFVRRLAAQSVVAIVQLLPEASWGATVLGDARERVRSRERAATNRQLLRRAPWAEVWLRAGARGVAPMLPLQADAVARWAEFVMSPRALEHVAVALDEAAGERLLPHSHGPERAPPQADSAAAAPAVLRDQVLRFKAVASPQAFALLRLLSGAWITLPVMRLLQHSMPGSRALSPLAEVLLSGLLRRTSAADARAEQLSFDFVPGVREWLSGSLSSDERQLLNAAMADSREAIRHFIETRLNRTLNSFGALLLDPAGDEVLPASARSFVEVSRKLLALRGGADGVLPIAGAAGTASGGAGVADETDPVDAPNKACTNDATGVLTESLETLGVSSADPAKTAGETSAPAEAPQNSGPQAVPQVTAGTTARASSAGAPVATDRRVLRILHLSDLHIGLDRPVNAWRQRAMMGGAWLDNLDYIQKQGPVELVCLAGDVALHGRPEEYREATYFVRQTMSALGLPMERFFCVPGNHDIDRRGSRLRPVVETMPPSVLSELILTGTKARGDAAMLRETLDQRRAAYHDWLQEIQRESLLPSAHEHGQLGFRVPVYFGDGSTVYVVGLDSAALSGSPEDDFAPRLTRGQLDRLLGLPELRGNCIALIHHPLDELADRADAERYLATAGACVLLGGQRTVGGGPTWEQRLSGVNVFTSGYLHRVPAAPTSVQVLELVMHPATGARRPRLEAMRVSRREWSDSGGWQDAGVAQAPAASTKPLSPEPAMASVTRPLEIYISHHWEDAAAVADLCRRLKAEGHLPIMDEIALELGGHWFTHREESVRKADVFLLCVSMLARWGRAMERELELALMHESTLPNGMPYILLARLKPCRLPSIVSNRVAVDLFEEDGYDRLLQALAQKQQQRLFEAAHTNPITPDIPRRPSIFFSYAREDRRAVRLMVIAIEHMGFDCVWFDVHEKIPRSAVEIEAAIDACDHFVAVLSASADSRLSGRYWEEWRRAALRQYRTNDVYLLPVSVDKRSRKRGDYPNIAKRMPAGFFREDVLYASQGRLGDSARRALKSLLPGGANLSGSE